MPILRSSFLSLRLFKLMLKWSVLLQRSLMRCLPIKSPLPIEAVWDTPEKVAQALMCPRGGSLLKSRNQWYQLVENVKVEKKPNVITQKVLTKPQNPFEAKPKAKGKSLPKS